MTGNSAPGAACPPPAGPVGQGDYVVAEGDCMDSIAASHGFFWRTLWDLPENAELKQVRGNPHILLPGDRVTIPAPRPKQETGSVGGRHRFKRRGEIGMLRFQLMDPAAAVSGGTGAAASAPAAPSPRANVPYVLEIDGVLTDGTTDGDGRIECRIPPGARRGRLVVRPGTSRQESFTLRLGDMDPVDQIAGVRKRLENLGYRCGRSDEMTPELRAALREFQERNGLEVSGEIEQAFRDKLVELHGC